MPDNGQLNYEAATQTIIREIYAPVFFEKLATDFGIQPGSDDEAREFLALASKLQQYNEAQLHKKANAKSSLISAANSQLDELLGNHPTVSNELEVKQAAQQLAQVPQLRNAALLYQDCVNQMLAK